MKCVEAIYSVTVLVLCCFVPLEAQGEAPIASRIVQALEHKEPRWKPIVGIESTHFPVVPSEKRILVATWYSEEMGGLPEGIAVRIYQVEDPLEAEKWLKPIRSGPVAQGWRVDSYDIGDHGYLAKYKLNKRFEIHFRLGNVVGVIAGNDLRRVKRFAAIVIAEIPGK